ncbi:TIGR04282 family arsenosugar biosynthesis glycosyltransferase [Ectothiorhodospira marina]|uniref:Glycosyltransferase n=1 Tax=Ectothiorhodospira marina TaxID=1396821 RepID=A0A1H7FVJ5_9GAMM|nr:TIGR04282 family arsenosugar biosynthesis glycosyltransferase [Ectothiorhodospira marina]SEK29931.1 hypothetical protein SAMN05444515_101351 [Ectothiorhodospira marina]
MSAMAEEIPVLVFTRAPVPGRTKTQLIPAVGAEDACRIHKAMVRHAMMVACAADCGSVIIHGAPDSSHPFLRKLAVDYGCALTSQEGVDRGDRIQEALGRALECFGGAIVIGTDCPEMTVQDIRQAADSLRSGCDAVLGPAHDGGYVLIGMRRMEPQVFQGIQWGTDQVLAQTRSRFESLGWSWHELESRRDLDTPEDWEILRETYPWLSPAALALNE